jgi:hypothetical protein
LETRIPEKNRKPGVCYAVTGDGIEVPVIDVTNACFRVEMGPTELATAVKKAVEDVKNREKTPPAEMQRQMQELLHGSFLAPRIAGARGKVLDGMSTYFLKLGPDNLGEGYAKSVDRVIAGSLPCLSNRLRLQDMARLMTDSLVPVLAARPGSPLHLVNIAGGPVMDSLNALILVQTEHPDALRHRGIVIHILDPDSAGPEFGARAASALAAPGGPLSGLAVDVRHVPYDWSFPTPLKELLVSLRATGAVVAGSSEGGLFEYGSDEDIVATLKIFHDETAGETAVVGSVTRADGDARVLNEASGAAVRLRGLPAFTSLVAHAGWKVARMRESPLSHDVVLMKDT